MLPIYLLVATVVILLCVFFNKITSKLGIPMLLAFILLGMFFGSDGIVKIPFSNYKIAEQICSVALIFIMFYGGFGTKWSEAKPIAKKALSLSTIGVLLTAGITGLFCYFVLKFPLLESFLIGAVISSTDAASVFSILRSKKLNLKYHTASLLEVESGSNDPCSYMLTIFILTLMQKPMGIGDLAYFIFAQFVYSIIFALIIAAASLWILKKFQFPSAGFDAVFVFAIALLSYAAPAALNGNGYLSVYLVGIILGNSSIKNKVSLVHFFDGVTGLTQMLIFFLLGLLSFPSELPQVIFPALCIALFLTFVARPIAVFALLAPRGCKLNQILLVSWAGLRGAASIVFAIVAVLNPAVVHHDIFHLVFFIVLFSILFQGSLLPFVSNKLNLIDENNNVLKTFTDYVEEIPIQFIEFTLKPNHPWVEKAVCDIILPPDTLLVLLKRENENIVPSGNTLLAANDRLILSAKSLNEEEENYLFEISIESGHEWVGKNVSQIVLEPNKLIIMIKRKDQIIIPTGDTVVEHGDILVFNQTD